MNIKILICDDEPILCKKTQEVIKSIDPNIDADTCYLGESVIDIADKYDIIFVDNYKSICPNTRQRMAQV